MPNGSGTPKQVFTVGEIDGTSTIVLDAENVLAAGSILASQIHATAINKVFNPVNATHGQPVPGWSTGIGHGASSVFGLAKSMRLETAGNLITRSDRFKVDPNKTYKVTAHVYCGHATGIRYFGMTAYNTAGAEVPVQAKTPTSTSYETAAVNPYFWISSGTQNPTEEITSYIIGHGVDHDDAEIPKLKGQGSLRAFRMPGNTDEVLLRCLNFSNAGTTSTAWFTHITVTEVDAGLITGKRLVAGSVDTPHLAANAIKAGNIDVGSLQAVSTNTGSLTVDGNIQSSNFTAGGQAGFQLRADGTAEFNGVVLSRQLMVDSGTFDFPNIGNNSGWDFRRDEVVEATAIPLTAWQGLEETYIAAAGFGTGVIVNADTDDIPDVYWGVVTEILPATRWSGNQSVRLLLSLYTKNIVSITGAGGASTFPVEWRIYRVT